ncbi:30S ribosomal protein S17 [Candidatus Parcubacteria bacterium]|nr:30S ribosomal protein S17 [Candidatus Parcubacteria bacterium]MBI4098974.1 30S ribosomal protein S17 [Candidatus Parcubacteria bacterium]MBI4385335.1 30S ribosomal protein S17 [Candidatus Parcubacteria bacterium]
MPKRILKGVVVSAKMAKTLVVAVDTFPMHPRYRKRYVASKRYKVHSPTDEYRLGDVVEIVESRPVSRDTHWTVRAKVGERGSPPEAGEESTI